VLFLAVGVLSSPLWVSVLMTDVFDHRGVIATPVAAGRPFQADFEQVTTSQQDKTRVYRAGRIYVDGEGRVRQDDAADSAAAVIDPVANVMYFVDRASGGILFQAPLSRPGEAVVHGEPREPAASQVQVSREELGSREIEGRTCRGFRTTVQGAGDFVAETWLAQDLGIVLSERRTTARGQIEQRLFNIVLGEPDPSLFKRLPK
jgi:hypothetical protein